MHLAIWMAGFRRSVSNETPLFSCRAVQLITLRHFKQPSIQILCLIQRVLKMTMITHEYRTVYTCPFTMLKRIVLSSAENLRKIEYSFGKGKGHFELLMIWILRFQRFSILSYFWGFFLSEVNQLLNQVVNIRINQLNDQNNKSFQCDYCKLVYNQKSWIQVNLICLCENNV